MKHPPCNSSNQNHTRHRRQTQTQLSAGGKELLEGQSLPGQIPGPRERYLHGCFPSIQRRHSDFVSQLPPQYQCAALSIDIGQITVL